VPRAVRRHPPRCPVRAYARVVLLLAAGHSLLELARRTGTSRASVNRLRDPGRAGTPPGPGLRQVTPVLPSVARPVRRARATSALAHNPPGTVAAAPWPAVGADDGSRLRRATRPDARQACPVGQRRRARCDHQPVGFASSKPGGVITTQLIRWPVAEPRAPVGRASAVATYRRTRRSDRRVLLAGDDVAFPGTDGAADAGTWAAAQLLSHAVPPIRPRPTRRHGVAVGRAHRRSSGIQHSARRRKDCRTCIRSCRSGLRRSAAKPPDIAHTPLASRARVDAAASVGSAPARQPTDRSGASMSSRT